MRIDQFTFGSIRIDGAIYDRDVVIDRGRCEGRSKTRTLAARKVEHPRQMLAESTTPFPCGFGG